LSSGGRTRVWITAGSFVYHYDRKAALPLVEITWVVYLALPFSLHPTFVVLSFERINGAD
jgi:hypothetical protein